MTRRPLALTLILCAAPSLLAAQSAPAGTPPTVPQTTPQTVPQTTPQSTPQTVPQTAPQTPPTTAPQKTPADSPDAKTGKTDKADKTDKKPAPAPAVSDKPVPLQAQVGPDGVVKGVKPGSDDDVSAVGNRNIGARGLGNWYSTNTEIGMGKQYSMELEKSTKFINDPVVTEYVNRIAQNIVKNSDARVPFTVKVIDSDEVNAMALPGGFFFVNSGLILNADNEAEVAGVMAHEIAHVAAHHAVREQTRMNYAQFSTIPLIMVGGGLGYGLYEAANIGIPLTFLQFSRDFEAQADFLGTQYLYRSGYDPQALVTFFEKIENLEKQKPGMISKAFMTHPATPDRIGRTQDEIATLLPPRNEYLENTSEFDDVKARLARIENKRKLQDKKDGNKPTLRKVGAQQDPNSTTAPGDDRPTLHKRDDSSSN
ncbi:M48 family metallopeptidase [Acidipila sp. EB88]|uniref:M48 family metallopeptidase n=1 Tax=Acidipila sp. EB88 TaxID=2305226 RepID=UPI000F5D4FC2|nr:M48 family metallopeptidase [Acidipila sp. EB88]RRA47276.1 peptidase M48 [Acidipila sp. EB88]